VTPVAPTLELRNLSVHFETAAGPVHALRDALDPRLRAGD